MLLDRWFAVYDKHYRSTSATFPDVPTLSDEPLSTLTGTPKVQRYINVWTSDVQPRDEADTSGVGVPLGLEELRRLAVEGVGKSKAGDGEGTYYSLPLEGRIDLMPPKEVKPESESMRPSTVKLLLPEGPQTPVRSSSPMTTLPTPGPHELPPTPVFRGHSLPPETPTHARSGAAALSFVTPDRDHLRPQVPRPSPTSLLSRPTSPGHPVTPPRRRSPPLLTWDPAVEAPPSAPPPASHFPEDTYFPNVWDAQSHIQPVPEDNSGFFPLPPAPRIPEMLIKEGHYQAVIGESIHEEPKRQPHQDEQIQQPQRHDQPPSEARPSHDSHFTHQASHPQPNRLKVAAVFPWEETPRHAPVRFFPSTDSPPPGLPFLKPQAPGLKLDLRPTATHGPLTLSLPHQRGFPQTSTYANAWDKVPSIQRYASRLVGPAPLPLPRTWTPDAGPTRKGNGRDSQRWQDLVEVSSRDADDEDEDDDEYNNRFNGGAASDPGRTLGDQSPLIKKSYRGRGVQTVPKETKEQSVQVSNGDTKQPTRSTSGNIGYRERAEATGLDAKTSGMSSHLLPAVSRPPTTSMGISNLVDEALSSPSPPKDALALPGLPSKPAPGLRPVGRIFDPARGVEVFKKSSEEVLERFLKVGSWDKDKTAVTSSPLTI